MRPLRNGDTIGVVSPASAVDQSVFSQIRAAAEQRGYRIKVFGEHDASFGRMAADDARRAENLMRAFCDDEVAAVLCSRGGYGSGRILDLLDPSLMGDKIFVGYSDVTNLLVHLHAHKGIVPFHGPMAADLIQKNDQDTIEWLFSMLEGSRFSYSLPPSEYSVIRTGVAEGKLYGGNISIFETLLGTNSVRVPEGAILLLEDVNEFMYALDRSLVHMTRAGVFSNASGIIFADLRLKDGMDRDNSLGLLLEEVLMTHFKGFAGPIAVGLPCGHTARQLTLPLGADTRLSVTHDCLDLGFSNFWDDLATRKDLAA